MDRCRLAWLPTMLVFLVIVTYWPARWICYPRRRA
jgi:hypothetical protein